MNIEILLAFLAFGTMGAVCVFAYLSAQRTEARLHSNTRPSTLAADGPDRAPAGSKPIDT